MKFLYLTAMLSFCLLVQSVSIAQDKADDKTPVVLITTNMGPIEVALNPSLAPITVKNFLMYVKKKHYDGTIFHRVMPGFMIQGGGLTPELMALPDTRMIRNEATNGLKNKRGTIAMARRGDPHSAMFQFFINVNDNDFLDHKNKSKKNYGYAVFGEVTSGMEIVDMIAGVKTKGVGQMQNIPVVTILIESIRLKK